MLTRANSAFGISDCDECPIRGRHGATSAMRHAPVLVPLGDHPHDTHTARPRSGDDILHLSVRDVPVSPDEQYAVIALREEYAKALRKQRDRDAPPVEKVVAIRIDPENMLGGRVVRDESADAGRETPCGMPSCRGARTRRGGASSEPPGRAQADRRAAARSATRVNAKRRMPATSRPATPPRM